MIDEDDAVIDQEVGEDPKTLKGAPYTTPVRRLDESFAARTLDVNYQG